MKGVVFTEFFGMVGAQFSDDMVDDLIDATRPASGGAYTAVGTYDHGEIVAMVVELARRSGTPVPDLLHAFGRYLFGRFHALHPVFFEGVTSVFAFLDSIESVIHAEVLKLHPDAELPSFHTEVLEGDRMVLVYRSPRHMDDLAAGLIEGCAAHFGEAVTVEREHREGGAVAFHLVRRPTAGAAVGSGDGTGSEHAGA
jgi:hypothetical protein